MYGVEGFFANNPIDRYGISTLSETLQANADGSMRVSIQRDYPGADRQSKWAAVSAGGVLPGPTHVSAGAAHVRRQIHRAAGDSNAGLKRIGWRTQASVFSTNTIVVRQARSGTRARLGCRGSFGRYGGTSGAHHRPPPPTERVAHRALGHACRSVGATQVRAGAGSCAASAAVL